MRFVYESVVPASVEEVFAFHESAEALARLQPPWERTRVVQPPTSLAVGTVVVVETLAAATWNTAAATATMCGGGGGADNMGSNSHGGRDSNCGNGQQRWWRWRR